MDGGLLAQKVTSPGSNFWAEHSSSSSDGTGKVLGLYWSIISYDVIDVEDTIEVNHTHFQEQKILYDKLCEVLVNIFI
jgi:hypothetical protein